MLFRSTGTGLIPGEYLAQVAPPGSDAVTVTFDPIASVGPRGVLDVTLVLPESREGTCWRLSIYQRNGRGGPNATLAQAPAFVSPGNVALGPARCEDLPKDIWARGDRVRASVTAPPYRVGEPITIAGTGLVPKDASRELGAALEVAHDPSGTSATRTVEHGAQTLDALGNFTFDQHWSEPTLEGISLELTFRGATLLQARMRPHVNVLAVQPNLLDPAGDGRRVLDPVFAASPGLAW